MKPPLALPRRVVSAAGLGVLALFALQALVSTALALLGLRAFVLRDGPSFAARVAAAGRLLRWAGAPPAAFVATVAALLALASGPGPLASPFGALFLFYGAACLGAGLAAAWLAEQAAASARHRWVKAAETAPFLLPLLHAAWGNAWLPFLLAR